jgi:1-acyl-sn-glycerol-3-phosphate acyltransferase
VQYRVSRVLAGPLLYGLWRPEVTGREHIPASGGAILASNHLSIVDSVFLPLMVDRPVTFAAKSEYFTGTRPIDRITGAYLRATKQLSVDRAGARAAQDMLEAALGLLREGSLFGIYPEGTRSPDGRLYRGKTGVARLALEGRAPVVPVAMIGGFEFQPPGRLAPRLTVRPGVRFGKPLDFSRYSGLEHDHIVLRAITDEIMYELMKLSGQEYVDEYAQRAKSRLAQARRHDGTTASGPGSAELGTARPAPVGAAWDDGHDADSDEDLAEDALD